MSTREIGPSHTPWRHGESGPLANFIEKTRNLPRMLEDVVTFSSQEWTSESDEESSKICITGEMQRYVNYPTFLGEKRWFLGSFSTILSLHLGHVLNAEKDFQVMAHYLRDARNVLSISAHDIKNMPISYVVATSNQKLIRCLMGIVPGFEVVDYLPEGKTRDSIVMEAYVHDFLLAHRVASLSFPVVAIPKDLFVSTLLEKS